MNSFTTPKMLLPKSTSFTFSLLLAVLTLMFVHSTQAANVTISIVQTFSSLDGSALDDDGFVNGVFYVDGNLTITSTGSIVCNDPVSPPNNSACPITINVTGNMVLQSGASIYAENRISGGNGGEIIISVGGNLTLLNESIISSSRTTTGGSGVGGDMTITVGGNVDFQTGSIVASACMGGGRAGDTRITAEGVIHIDGLVSAGPDYQLFPLPDRLFDFVLENGNTTQKGAKIIIVSHVNSEVAGVTIGETGILISQGQDPASDTVSIEACGIEIYGMVASVAKKGNASTTNRPVVVLRSSQYILINGEDLGSEGTNQGRVRADYVIGEAPESISVNMYAKDDIAIIGPSSGTIFSTSSNGGYSTNQPGGTVNGISFNGGIDLSGLAIQASGIPGSGSMGGSVNLKAFLDIDLSNSLIEARGSTTGGNPDGGYVNIRSYSGDLISNNSSTINVTGGSPLPEGTVVLTACGSIGFPAGNIIPATVIPSKTFSCSPGAPSLPEGINPLPSCGSEEEYSCHWCNKGAVLSQVWQNMNGDTCAIPDILVDVRLPHTPVDASKIHTGEPATGSIQAAVDYVNAHGDPTPGDGQIFIGVIATDCGSNPEGFQCETTESRGLGGDTPFGIENVTITNENPQRLNIFGCSVTLHADDTSQPVMRIVNSVGKVTVLDIHVKYSEVEGYLIQNNDDLVVVKNSRSMYHDIGYRVQDDDVQITGSQASSHNRIGMLIEGDYNILRTNNDIMDNSEAGIKITGHHNESNGNDVGKSGHPNPVGILVTGHYNELHGDNVTYNTCNGLEISGNYNEIADEDAQHNGCNGMVISGNYNILEGNKQVKFNGHDGIFISGDNNSLEGNVGSENGRNGICADLADGANGNTFEENEAEENVLQGIRACGQVDNGDNEGEDNGMDPQVAFVCSSLASFEVTDMDEDKIYKYDASFNLVSSSLLASDDGDGNDVTTNSTNSYVLDKSDKQVYRYVGTMVASKILKEVGGGSLSSPCGIAINEDSLWVADGSKKKIYRYSLSSAFAGAGNLNAVQEIAFTGNNGNAEGLIAEGAHVYVLDNSDKQFYRYPKTGGAGVASKVMKETTGGSLGTPIGATSDGTSFWIVDNGKDKAYKYSKMALFSAAGNLNATSQYLLYPDNAKSTGIAIGNNTVFPLVTNVEDYPVDQDSYNTGVSTMMNKLEDESSMHTDLFVKQSPLQVYPNPTRGQITLKFNSAVSTPYILKVADISGRILIQSIISATAGVNFHELDLHAISSGLYIVNLSCTGENYNVRLIVE